MEHTFYKLSIAGKSYIGSTTNLYDRKKKHKCDCNKKDYNLKVYNFIRENGGWDKVKIMIIDKIICHRNDALDFETKYMKMFNCELNSIYPKRSSKEYYENNKESIAEKCKKYREKNKESIAEKSKEYYENNREEIIEYSKKYREKNIEKITENSKVYKKNNKESIIEKGKEYYENNKESIIEKCKEYREKNKEKIK